jgi:hypothetical protein
MRKGVFAAAVAAALVLSAVASGGNLKAGAAKPGPEAVPASVGTVVRDNSGALKQGIAAARPASVVLGKAPSLAASPMLRGYVVVNSGSLSNPNNTQSFGDVQCPTNTVAFGGGVFGDSSSVFQDVNSSFPEVSGSVATGWGGYVDNFSGADSTFSVWAVCAKKPANYAVVSAGFDNPPGTQVQTSVQCPIASTGHRMKVFGGGGIGNSFGLLQNINTDFPVKTSKSWRVDMNNAGSSDESGVVYAVCGMRAGWEVDAGTAVANPASSQSFANVACSSGKTSVGGGVYSDSGSTSVNLNATWPQSNSLWGSYENNASGSDASITPYAVCLS